MLEKRMNTGIQRFKCRPTKPRGFTLFEIVLVVLIVGIIGAVVVPAAMNMGSPRLKTAANVLAADIEFCLSECVARPNDPRVVYFDTVNNKYSLVALNSSSIIAHPSDSQPYTNDFATGRNAGLTGVTLTSVAMGNTAMTVLTFDPYGKPILTTDLIITLTYQGQRMCVKVLATTGETSIFTP